MNPIQINEQFQPITDDRDSAFNLTEKIAPVAIVYGGGVKLFVTEANSSRRLLKELWRLGRKGIRIRGMISEAGAADRASLDALNAYLFHFYGRQSLNSLRSGQLHRLCWHDLQRAVALRWVR